MKTKLTRNLQIGFGLSVLFLICISAASYISIQNLFETSGLVNHSKLVTQKLENVISIMKDAETGQRGYLLTGDSDFLTPYNGSYRKVVKVINEFQKLTDDEIEQYINGAKIKAILFQRLDILQQLVEEKRAGVQVTTTDLRVGKSAMDELRSTVTSAEKYEDFVLRRRLAELERFTSMTPMFLIFATLIAISIAVFSYFRVTGGLSERDTLYAALQIKEHETARGNEDLAAANEELNATNEQLVEAHENVNELNEKLGASNEELLATVDELYQSQQNLQALNDELEDRIESRTKALTESESRFRVMMETMPQIAWTSTNGGEVTFFNKQWYNYTGLNKEQSMGWGWTSAVHPDDLPDAGERYKAILASGNEGEFETRKKRADGVYRWHLVRIQPVISDTGELQLWVGTATDIDELKNLQQQKDDFISIASHELKTPVTSLKVSLQLLDRNKDNLAISIVPKLIGQANKSIDRVGALIEDLLNVSKLNQGQLHLNKTYFNINQMVNDCCQYVRAEGLYSIVATGDLELEAYADLERIEQVVVNFVNNALKYAPESKEIHFKIERENDMAKVSVSDKGPGIAPDKVSHLFQRYYRVDSQGQQFSGLGLGLYISSEIIKRHNGQIGVNTEVDKGSTFWFTIPLQG